MSRKVLFPLLLCCLTTVLIGADRSRQIAIDGWSFLIPTFFEKSDQPGPDGYIVNLASKERKLSLDFYRVNFPPVFAEGKVGVREEVETIWGQEARWSVWEKSEDKEKQYCAEVSLFATPEDKKYERPLHVVIAAPSQSNLRVLRQIVREARQISQPK